MGDDKDPIVEIQGLGFKWGRSNVVLEDLSVSVNRSAIFGVVGASGSGKTTLMRLITGIIKPNSGNIRVFGEIPSNKIMTQIGYMPQAQAIYRDLTVAQNLHFFARMFGLAKVPHRRDVVDSTIHRVSLWHKRDHLVDRLSGGERQRVSLAITMIHNPPLLLLDEPTVGLDPRLRIQLWDYFHELADRGTTVVISTHNMEDAARCDYLGFLQFGRMLATGTPLALMKSTGLRSASLEDAFLHFINEAGAHDN